MAITLPWLRTRITTLADSMPVAKVVAHLSKDANEPTITITHGLTTTRVSDHEVEVSGEPFSVNIGFVIVEDATGWRATAIIPDNKDDVSDAIGDAVGLLWKWRSAYFRRIETLYEQFKTCAQPKVVRLGRDTP